MMYPRIRKITTKTELRRSLHLAHTRIVHLNVGTAHASYAPSDLSTWQDSIDYRGPRGHINTRISNLVLRSNMRGDTRHDVLKDPFVFMWSFGAPDYSGPCSNSAKRSSFLPHGFSLTDSHWQSLDPVSLANLRCNVVQCHSIT